MEYYTPKFSNSEVSLIVTIQDLITILITNWVCFIFHRHWN